MSVKFTKLKSPLLGLKDAIAVGRNPGLLIIDLLETERGLLQWYHQKGIAQFNDQILKELGICKVDYSAREYKNGFDCNTFDDEIPF